MQRTLFLVFSTTIALAEFDTFRSLNRLSNDEDRLREINCGIPARVRKVLHGDRVKNFTTAPYAVALASLLPSDDNEIHAIFCSGTLISTRHVLTAGHCLQAIEENCRTGSVTADLSTIHIALRTFCTFSQIDSKYCKKIHPQGPILAKAKRIILPSPHMSISCGVHHHDLMVIELENDIIQEPDVQFACIPTSELEENVDVQISGYGSDEKFKKGEPPISLLKTYKTKTVNCEKTDQARAVRHDHICTTNKKMKLACGGDSGSGAISKSNSGKNQIHAVLHGGTNCSEVLMKGKYYREHPTADVLTSLIPYLDWLCFVTGICPRQQDREMMSKYLANTASPHPSFTLVNNNSSQNQKRFTYQDGFGRNCIITMSTVLFLTFL